MRITSFIICLLFLSCGGDDSSKTLSCANCEILIGKRWYLDIDRDIDNNCRVIEDFTLEDNGTVTAHRFGYDDAGNYFEKTITNACSYELESNNNCKLTMSALSPSWHPAELDSCQFALNFSLVGELEDQQSESFNIILNDCDNFSLSVFTFLDYEP